MKTIAIILSGGTGMRLGGDIPKQYISISHKMIITYAMQTLARHEKIHGILVVAAEEWRGRLKAEWDGLGLSGDKFLGFVRPGETRQLSIWNALEWLNAEGREAWTDSTEKEERLAVLIHDAARPFLRSEQITECLAAMEGHDGVMPVLPMKDTVYRSADGKQVTELLDRGQIFAGQAPELFEFAKYLEANAGLFPDKILEINGSTEPAVMAGMDIAMTPGDERNFKITTQDDLLRAREILESKND